MRQMRAISQDTTGGPEVLRLIEKPVPEPVPTEIRVRVIAAGVNPVDWKTRSGAGMSGVLGTPPFTVGWDVAGVVDAVGQGVTRFAVGDRVYGMPWFPREAGAYAEYVTAPARHFAASPSTVDDVHAGALPLAALTAWQALVDTAGVNTGQRVLVHAAAGGVGHLAVQIAKARGAVVVGTASAAKHDFLRELGADELVDYRAAAFESVIDPVDVVLDLVGGETTRRSLKVLRPGGRLIRASGSIEPDIVAEAADRGRQATGFLVEPDHAGLRSIAALVDAGVLRVTVSASFPLSDAGRAHELGEQSRNTGKTVLLPAEPGARSEPA